MGYKVLVCEDNENNRRLIKDILEYHGFEVYLASNGEEGIRMAKELKPDIILMDMQMPVFDGFEAIKRIRADTEIRHIKIMVVTSYAMPGDKDRAMKIGADHYIAKPIDTRSLPFEIKKVIES